MHSVMPGLPYYCNVLIPILISTATVLVWTHRQSWCITDSCRRVPRTLSVKQSTPCMHLMLSNEAWKDRYLSNMCACMCNETAVKILQQQLTTCLFIYFMIGKPWFAKIRCQIRSPQVATISNIVVVKDHKYVNSGIYTHHDLSIKRVI